MATGQITSPATWLLGTVASPSWFQNVQDNINAWFTNGNPLAATTVSATGNISSSGGGLSVTGSVVGQTSVSKRLWIPWCQAAVISGAWSITGFSYNATAGSQQLAFPIVLPTVSTGTVATSGTAPVITGAALRCSPASSTPITFTLAALTNMVLVPGSSPSYGSIISAGSSVSGNQSLSLSLTPLSVTASEDRMPFFYVNSGTSGDVIYGIELFYTSCVF